jgi:hypothetical protein
LALTVIPGAGQPRILVGRQPIFRPFLCLLSLGLSKKASRLPGGSGEVKLLILLNLRTREAHPTPPFNPTFQHLENTIPTSVRKGTGYLEKVTENPPPRGYLTHPARVYFVDIQ